ncbi:hypothetical protein DPMN_063481 [Dreissena polymorpha]|uniref:Uncharacterized protein n=1 Tax=Dreissena polymorpha TaxID=45954 RepID=A0A9D4CAL0_DREPO|nr:hypothetical protein DPMN_062981 [Dreissena polymorpha]KAH3720581.1 hypothetical protein DPMN_063481 [Dreissena polymorpha]
MSIQTQTSTTLWHSSQGETTLVSTSSIKKLKVKLSPMATEASSIKEVSENTARD